jgi:hypothetical protein
MNLNPHTHDLGIAADDKRLRAVYGDTTVKLKLRWYHRFASRDWLMARTARKAIKRHDRSIDANDANTRLQSHLKALRMQLQPAKTADEQREANEAAARAAAWREKNGVQGFQFTRTWVDDVLHNVWRLPSNFSPIPPTEPVTPWTPMLDAVGFTVEQTIAKTETPKLDWRYTLSKLDAAKDRLRIVSTPSFRDGDTFRVTSKSGYEFGSVNLSGEMINRATAGYTPGIKEELAYQVEKLPGISEYLASSLVIG